MRKFKHEIMLKDGRKIIVNSSQELTNEEKAIFSRFSFNGLKSLIEDHGVHRILGKNNQRKGINVIFFGV